MFYVLTSRLRPYSVYSPTLPFDCAPLLYFLCTDPTCLWLRCCLPLINPYHFHSCVHLGPSPLPSLHRSLQEQIAITDYSEQIHATQAIQTHLLYPVRFSNCQHKKRFICWFCFFSMRGCFPFMSIWPLVLSKSMSGRWRSTMAAESLEAKVHDWDLQGWWFQPQKDCWALEQSPVTQHCSRGTGPRLLLDQGICCTAIMKLSWMNRNDGLFLPSLLGVPHPVKLHWPSNLPADSCNFHHHSGCSLCPSALGIGEELTESWEFIELGEIGGRTPFESQDTACSQEDLAVCVPLAVSVFEKSWSRSVYFIIVVLVTRLFVAFTSFCISPFEDSIRGFASFISCYRFPCATLCWTFLGCWLLLWIMEDEIK